MVQQINLSKLYSNTGQIPGLPKNPRLIRNEKFAKLVQSISDDPEMLDLRELIVFPLEKDKFVVICGNMRFKAAEELGLTSLPCKVLSPEVPAEKLRAVSQKDNLNYGENDFEALYNEWNIDELTHWGLDLAFPEEAAEAPEQNEIVSTTIKLEYTLEDYERVKNYLALIDSSPEQAVWKLCGFD